MLKEMLQPIAFATLAMPAWADAGTCSDAFVEVRNLRLFNDSTRSAGPEPEF